MDEVDTAGGDQSMPLFDTFRRGYDPEQVDRYLEDQKRRLEEANRRAVEAERRLGQAMDQLHAMSVRITELERREPAPAPAAPAVPIDLLGDRIQRILQEAWDGAFALRQSVESEVSQLREQAVAEAARIVEEAKSKAHGIENQMRRRREAYLMRAEQDKSKAVAQMTFLSDQRKAAIAELVEIKERIESAIVEVPTHTAANLMLVSTDDLTQGEDEPSRGESGHARSEGAGRHPSATASPAPPERPLLQFGDDDLPPTLAVHRLPSFESPHRPADASSLVRSHREVTARSETTHVDASPESRGSRVFDFEADEDGSEH